MNNPVMEEINDKVAISMMTTLKEYFNKTNQAAGDKTLDFIKWQTKQMDDAAAKYVPPKPAEIVEAIVETDFSFSDSIDTLCSLLWADNAPDIPLAESSKFKMSLRPSTTLLQVTLPPFTDPSGPIGDDGISGEVDYANLQPPTFNRYLVALIPSLPATGKEPEPPSVALQLGNLLTTTKITPKPEDWSETDFIIVLNILDLSLWIAFNYTPFDELGQLDPIPIPKTIDPKSPPGGALPGLSDDKRFDIAMLLDGDAMRNLNLGLKSAEDVKKNIEATRATRGLVANTIEDSDVAKALFGFRKGAGEGEGERFGEGAGEGGGEQGGEGGE